MLVKVATSMGMLHKHNVVRAVQMDAAICGRGFQVARIFTFVTQDAQQPPYVQQVHTAWVVPLQWHVLNALLGPLQPPGPRLAPRALAAPILWQGLGAAPHVRQLTVVLVSS